MLGFSKKASERGQALLIIVLIMVVALTVGLSVATRSITSLRTSTEEVNSAQALSAAEAGLERSLSEGTTVSDTLSNQASYTTSVTTKSGNQMLLNNGALIPKDEGVDLWFVAHTCGTDGKSPCWSSPWQPNPPGPGGNVVFYWDTNSCNDSAALEVVVISGSVTSPVLNRYVYDPCSPRRTSNKFSASSPGGQIEGKTLNYSTGNIAVSNGLMARIIPIYKDTIIGVIASGSPLPSQGSVVTATGSFGSDKSKIVRKLTAFQSYPQLPTEFLTFGIFSPSN